LHLRGGAGGAAGADANALAETADQRTKGIWRAAGDLGIAKDGSLWGSMPATGFGQAGKERWAGPGGWNDPDNIFVLHLSSLCNG
jgi:hypothetical protein